MGLSIEAALYHAKKSGAVKHGNGLYEKDRIDVYVERWLKKKALNKSGEYLKRLSKSSSSHGHLNSQF